MSEQTNISFEAALMIALRADAQKAGTGHAAEYPHSASSS